MTQKSFAGPERRTYTRIVYQAGQRPKLLYKNHRFEVTDISERGLAFVNAAGIRLGKILEATVVFADGKSFAFTGKVKRRTGPDVGVYFDELMPHPLVIQQQQAALKIG